MSRLKKLGANIRALRIAYGLTQEQLGEAIFVEKNSVSYYETGKREPNKDTLAAIANHFMISVEELLNDDFTGINEILIDETAMWKNIGILFPIVSSRQAIENQHFKKAFDLHKAFYEELNKVNLDVFGALEIEYILDGYDEAVEVDEIKAEAAANLIAINLLLMVLIKWGGDFSKNKPAALRHLLLRTSIKSDFEDEDPSFEEDFKLLQEKIDGEEMNEWFSEMLTTVKHSEGLSDLADYYLALRYVLNLVDNGLGYGFNQRIGGEMMTAFFKVKNQCAAKFIKLSNSFIRRSSQSVDDK